jgi:von Willebrand factor type A domain/Inner membrane component of T3SS, cytoplasmic domain
MGMKRLCLLMLLLGCFPGDGLAQGEPGRFAVSQVTFRSPVLTAYVDTLDQNGQPPAKLDPAQFSATINQQNLTVSSATPFGQSGEGVAYIFLVDISKSIQPKVFAEMRTQIDNWIGGMGASDQMAIYTFGDEDKELADFTSNKSTLVAALQNVMPSDLQTKLYLALRNAINLGQRTDANLPTRRVIVIASDGKDEGSGFTSDDVGRLVQPSRVPIYAIGFSSLPEPDKDTYLDALNRIAALSGGLYINGKSLPQAYTQIRQAIQRVFVVQLACAQCQMSSQSTPLEMTLKSGTAARTAQVAVSLTVTASADNSVWKWVQDHVDLKITISVFVIFLLAAAASAWYVIKRKPQPPIEVMPLPPPPPERSVKTVDVTPGRKVQLTVMSGNERGRVDKLNLSARAVVGRDKTCNVSYPADDEMSAKHFELVLAGSHIEVQDLGSTNGTIMNGSRLITQQRLEDGDWVRAGRTELRITFGG